MNIDWKMVLAMGTFVLMIILAITVCVVGIAKASDEGATCPSIKAVMVDPRFIVKQPDGDTFHIFTFDVPNVVKIRVKDAETPERGYDGFDEAKAFTREWLSRGPFRVITCGTPTLDRIVGIVSRGDDTLAGALKTAGYWRWKH